MRLAIVAVGLLWQTMAEAEIVSASDTHFVLRHEASSELTPGDLWQRLTEPAAWWHPDHTYSGHASNLSLDAQAGGLWREDWDGGSVSHGRVLYVDPGRTLRLEAPFGPLQALGAYTIWTITISAGEQGSVVVFRRNLQRTAGRRHGRDGQGRRLCQKRGDRQARGAARFVAATPRPVNGNATMKTVHSCIRNQLGNVCRRQAPYPATPYNPL